MQIFRSVHVSSKAFFLLINHPFETNQNNFNTNI